MLRGRIKNVKAQKQFGFIQVINGKDEYFFHKDDFNGHWIDLCDDVDSGGQQITVTFEPDNTPKGLRARNVSREDYPNQVEGGWNGR